jgi:enterobactin synthetase component F
MAGQDAGGDLERAAVLARLREGGSALGALGTRVLDAVVRIVVHNSRLMREHEHGVYEGAMTFVTAAAPRSEDWLDRDGWAAYVRGPIVNHDIAATHPELTRPGPLGEIGRLLAGRLVAPGEPVAT